MGSAFDPAYPSTVNVYITLITQLVRRGKVEVVIHGSVTYMVTTRLWARQRQFIFTHVRNWETMLLLDPFWNCRKCALTQWVATSVTGSG